MIFRKKHVLTLIVCLTLTLSINKQNTKIMRRRRDEVEEERQGWSKLTQQQQKTEKIIQLII